jgi:hypothetical protein
MMEVTMPKSLHSAILKNHENCSGLLVDVMAEDIACWDRLQARWATLVGES